MNVKKKIVLVVQMNFEEEDMEFPNKGHVKNDMIKDYEKKMLSK